MFRQFHSQCEAAFKVTAKLQMTKVTVKGKSNLLIQGMLFCYLKLKTGAIIIQNHETIRRA